MNLREADTGREYVIDEISTDDAELDAFLFSLGCYKGESIGLIAKLRGSCTVFIKNARYNIDTNLAEAISVAE